MHSTIAHHQLTNAQPVPKQQQPPSQLPQPLLPRMSSYGLGHTFGQFGPAVLAVSPLISCCTPSPLAVRAAREP